MRLTRITTNKHMKHKTLSPAQLDALIDRIKQAQEHQLALSPEDLQLILNSLLSLITMQHELASQSITVKKLRKLAGIVNADERLSKLLGQANSETESAPSELAKHKKNRSKPAKPRTKSKPHQPVTIEHHKLCEAQKNMICMACGIGTLRRYHPAEFIRISAHSPYEVTKHVLERLRCNHCGEYYTATLTGPAAQDGPIEQKYGYSARALMAINKYHMGAPFNRQTGLQELLHVPISASTIYDQCESLAGHLVSVLAHLELLTASSRLIQYDDTHNRILNQTHCQKPDRKTGQLKDRTGTYTTGVIATLKNDQEVVLFNTGIGHAGEYIDQLMKRRDGPEPPLITMTDALSRNKVYATDTVAAFCNAHARREFVDLLEIFPEPVNWILARYQIIWQNEEHAKTLSQSERLSYHQEHSLPVMLEIQSKCTNDLQTEEVEANSNLGKAMKYFLNHFKALTQFCCVQGVPLDNNRTEGMLKIVIRNRKNAYFYKTPKGAEVSDIITSILATCLVNNVNAFDYLCYVQRNHDAAAVRPEDFLPWNYRSDTTAKKVA